MRFKAFRIHDENGKIAARFDELTLDDLSAGEVVIRTWDRDAVRVQARHRERAKVSIRPSAAQLSISSDSGAMGSTDFEISVPTWMPMRVSGTFNFITVEGAQSEVVAETTRGDVVIKGGSGAITAKSIQGEVIVEGAGIETLQTVERTTFIERPHRTIGETI